MDLGLLLEEFRGLFPDLVVEEIRGSSGLSIHPPRSGFPQVNIRILSHRVEWRGYWREVRWGRPIGRVFGLPDLNYVLPQSFGRACDPVLLSLDSRDQVVDLTRAWFERHPPGEVIGPPPVPEGSRMATEEELAAAEIRGNHDSPSES